MYTFAEFFQVRLLAHPHPRLFNAREGAFFRMPTNQKCRAATIFPVQQKPAGLRRGTARLSGTWPTVLEMTCSRSSLPGADG